MRFGAFILIILHSISLLLTPLDTKNLNIRSLYVQCSIEDPDLTPVDFVFGHLLNLEYLIQAIEGEQEQEHQPLSLAQQVSPTPVILPAMLTVAIGARRQYASNQHRYNLYHPATWCAGVAGRVFRPPVTCFT
jgi:hypothetical protein